MKFMQLRRRTIIEAGLLLGIILLVGFTVFYVLDTNKKVSKTLANPTQSAPKASKASAPSPLVNPAGKAENGVMVIKDWGVQLPAQGVLADATYYGVDKNPTIIYLSTATLDAAPACITQAKAVPGVYSYQWLVRFHTTTKISTTKNGKPDTPISELAIKQPDAYKHIGDYYYFFGTASGLNCDESKAVLPAYKAAFANLST